MPPTAPVEGVTTEDIEEIDENKITRDDDEMTFIYEWGEGDEVK